MLTHRFASLLAVGTWILLLAACAAVRPAVGRSANPSEQPLRVVTANIRHGQGNDDRVDLERTARALAALEPDIAALQEVDRRVRRSGRVDQAQWLGERLGLHATFGAFMEYDGGDYGCAILSRWPIREARPIRLPEGHEPRVALEADIELPSGEVITVVNIHLDWVEDDSYRLAQAQVVANRLRQGTRPSILLGDFNDQPGSRTLHLLETTGDRLHKSDGGQCTFPSPAPEIEIDHLVCIPAGAWSAEEVRVIDERMASDHRPVRAILRRRSPVRR